MEKIVFLADDSMFASLQGNDFNETIKDALIPISDISELDTKTSLFLISVDKNKKLREREQDFIKKLKNTHREISVAIVTEQASNVLLTDFQKEFTYINKCIPIQYLINYGQEINIQKVLK